MLLEILIERWTAIMWIVFGLSHALYPKRWTDLLIPLRDRETGGLLIGAYTLPVGLVTILGHNVWGWRIATIVTLFGWFATIKGLAYLLLPRAHRNVMPSESKAIFGFRAAGITMVALGTLVAYDAFWVN